MTDALEMKIRQMHAALTALSSQDLSRVRVDVGVDGSHQYLSVDFNDASSDVDRANAASLLTANIASLKDHLKVWCRSNNKNFEGDKLIDSNKSVAIIHDLWNMDKHAELSRPPRSGHRPKLKGVRTSLRLTTGTSPGSATVVTFDPRTGKMNTKAAGGGSVALVLDAEVVDEFGTRLGMFRTLCEEAVEAWLQILRAAGVPIPL